MSTHMLNLVTWHTCEGNEHGLSNTTSCQVASLSLSLDFSHGAFLLHMGASKANSSPSIYNHYRYSAAESSSWICHLLCITFSTQQHHVPKKNPWFCIDWHTHTHTHTRYTSQLHKQTYNTCSKTYYKHHRQLQQHYALYDYNLCTIWKVMCNIITWQSTTTL